jgi:cation diffusion facilitator CzcD-associated flavoprotein CzcO
MSELLQSLEFWSIAVAVLALIASAWASWRANRISAEQTQLQRRLVELEEERERARKLDNKRANLKAELVRKDTKPHIRIENRGAAEARNIRGRLNGERFEEHECTKRLFQPIDAIGPDSHTRVPLIIFMQATGQPPFDLVLRWDDDAQIDATYRTTLR